MYISSYKRVLAECRLKLIKLGLILQDWINVCDSTSSSSVRTARSVFAVYRENLIDGSFGVCEHALNSFVVD